MFADLCDSTRLAAAMEAEEYAALLDSVLKICGRVIVEHRGQVLRIQGDGMLAIFGYPQANEHDGRRAVEAALALHESIRAMPTVFDRARPNPAALHIGIHAGLSVIMPGDDMRGVFDLAGKTPNIAARLAAAAGPGETFVSEETLGRDVSRFVVHARRELHCDGLETPCRVLSIAGRAGDARVHVEQRLVGRDPEVARLQAAMAAAAPGMPQRLTIVGDAGIGKTSLAGAFLDDCARSGIEVLQARCDGGALTAPFFPLVQMLRLRLSVRPDATRAEVAAAISDLVRSMPWLGDSQASSLSIALGEALDVTARGGVEAVRSALAALLEALTRFRAAVLFVDDWHWADDASHQVLASLLESRKPAVLLLLAARDLAPSDAEVMAPSRVVALSPLDPDAAALAVRRWLPGADPFVVEAICVRAGGNPLFLEELCRRASLDPSSHSGIEGPAGDGAAWLHLLIEARVARMAGELVHVLRCAAVLGSTFPVWLFTRMTGCTEVGPEVQALREQDWISSGETPGILGFKHAIVRDAVYLGIGLQERRRLHASAIAAFEHRSGSDDGCEMLAFHHWAAGDYERAAEMAVRAGDRALSASALDRAQAHYRCALDSLDLLPMSPALAREWIAVASRLGLACVFDPSGADLRLFERSVEVSRIADDRTLSTRSLYWLAYVQYALGNQCEALRLCGILEQPPHLSDDLRLQTQIRAMHGQTLVACGRYGHALLLLEEAVATKRRYRSGGGLSVGLAYSLATLGFVLADLGRFDAAQPVFDEARALLPDAAHEVAASVSGVHAAALLWQGRWLEAQEAAERTHRIARQVRSLFTLSMGRVAAAYARWRQQADPSEIDVMLEAEDWLVRRGNRLFASLVAGWLTDALADAGRLAQARRHAAVALRRAREFDCLGAPMACRAIARLEAARGRHGVARRWIRRANRLASARGSAHELACNQWVAFVLEGDGSSERRAALVAEFERLGMHWHAAQVAAGTGGLRSEPPEA